MTAPVAKAVAKKAAGNAGASAGAKKYAQTKSANPVRPKPKSTTDNGGGVSKKSAIRVVRTTKKVGKKAYSGSFDSKFAPKQRPTKSVVTYRHIIALEFWIGLVFILTRPSKSKVKENELVQAAAFIFMHAILFGISAMGRNAARLAAAFGGLVLLVLLMMDQTDGRFGAITTDPNAPPPDLGAGPKQGSGGPGQRKPVTS